MLSEREIKLDDRAERLLEGLVETPAGERIRMRCGATDLRSVITDILSALPYEVNKVDAERLADYHKIGNIPAVVKSTDYGATSLAECVEKAVDRWYHRGRRDAATATRDLCVGRVRAMGQQWYGEAKRRGAAFSDKGRLADEIATELESLTLEPPLLKQSERKK